MNDKSQEAMTSFHESIQKELDSYEQNIRKFKRIFILISAGIALFIFGLGILVGKFVL